MKNVLFIGVGSIAKRHICNLRHLLKDEVTITVLRSGNGIPLNDEIMSMIDSVCFSRDDLYSHYDIIFITNPTSLHYKALKEYIELGDAFFIEKPVFVTGEEDIAEFEDSGKTFYVACPLRYTGVISYLKDNIEFSKVYSIRCISSSYLPEWRPDTDYRKCYSAHKDMGGGVAIDLIHEWDYICHLTGFPQKMNSIITRKSDLEIDSDDIAVYIADYADKTVELHLDYFGRVAQRKIELFTKDDIISGDLINHTITFTKAGIVKKFHEDRNDFYLREMKHFIDISDGKAISDNSLKEACKVLRIARGVE